VTHTTMCTMNLVPIQRLLLLPLIFGRGKTPPST
jgi:hypothetical protein